jgi:hypothetical protein
MPIRTLNDEDFVYVNSKQYWRILLRREQRKKLNIKSRFDTAESIKRVTLFIILSSLNIFMSQDINMHVTDKEEKEEDLLVKKINKIRYNN